MFDIEWDIVCLMGTMSHFFVLKEHGVVTGVYFFCGINKVDSKTLLSTLFD